MRAFLVIPPALFPRPSSLAPHTCPVALGWVSDYVDLRVRRRGGTLPQHFLTEANMATMTLKNRVPSKRPRSRISRCSSAASLSIARPEDVRRDQSGHRRDHLPGGRGGQGRRRQGRQGRPQGPGIGAVEHDGRRRSRPAALQAGRPGRAERRGAGDPRIAQLRQDDHRLPRRHAGRRSTRCAITPAGPTRSKAGRCPCAATSCPTRCGSRSAWSARSFPGTSRC